MIIECSVWLRAALRMFVLSGDMLGIIPSVSGDPANLPPSATIVFPPDQVRATDGTRVALKADAIDPDGAISAVEFYKGTNFIGAANSPPYTNVFVAVDIVTLTAVAIDNFGARATSAPVHVFAIQPPTSPLMIITSPANHSTLAAPATVTIEASLVSTDGAEWPATFFIGTNLVGEVPDPPYRFTVSNLLAGDYTFRVHVDTGGRYRPFYTNDFNPIEVQVVPLLQQLPAFGADRGFQFETAGDIVSKTIVIEGSTNLVGWLPISTNVPATSNFLFRDAEATNYQRRFYRVSFVP